MKTKHSKVVQRIFTFIFTKTKPLIYWINVEIGENHFYF